MNKYDALLRPKSIAILNLSIMPGEAGYETLNNLLNSRFEGDIVPVNSDNLHILGAKCYGSLKDYGAEIDLCLIADFKGEPVGRVSDLIEYGVKAVGIISGSINPESEKRIIELCEKNNVPLLGAGSVGVINVSLHMNASSLPDIPFGGAVSFFSQSPGICGAFIDTANNKLIGVSKVVSLGAGSGLGSMETLSLLGGDADCRIVAGFLNNIADGEKFVKVAKKITSQKPVVLLMGGLSRIGRLINGQTEMEEGYYEGLLNEAGIIQAKDYEALFDLISSLSAQPLPEGNRAAVISNESSLGAMAIDAIVEAGFKLPYSDDPESEPVTALGSSHPERYLQAIRNAFKDDKVNAVIVIISPGAFSSAIDITRAIASAAQGPKPLMAVFLGNSSLSGLKEEFVKSGLPVFGSPQRAASTLKGMYGYYQWLTENGVPINGA